MDMGNNPSSSEHTQKDKEEEEEEEAIKDTIILHNKHLDHLQDERKGSISSNLFTNKNSSKRHATSIMSQSKVTNDNIQNPPETVFFKKGYSISRSMQDDSDIKTEGQATVDSENIHEPMASLSLKTSMENDENRKSFSFMSPGPANPTVEQTKHDVTNKENSFEHRPSIVTLKQTLSGTKVTNDNNIDKLNKTISSSSNSQSVSTASSSSIANRTGSIDIPKENRYNFKDAMDTIPKQHSVHAYQHDYFTINDENARNGSDGRLSTSGDNSEPGVLQNVDIVLNQSFLKDAMKRDMKRKRTDTGASTATPDIEKPTEKKKPISATAAMMLKLYGDKNQMEKEEKKSSGSYSYADQYEHSTSQINLREVKKIKHIENDFVEDNFGISSPKEIKIQHIDDVKNAPPSSLSSSMSSSSFGPSSDEQTNDNVQVVLKWRDQIDNPKHCKISIVSDDISSAIPAKATKAGKLPMLFNPMIKEWYVPNLLLPPGIYRLKFSINGDLTHSNFLPTATDSMGNIVNWFEVLPGYDTVEPYRDEIIETTFHTNGSQGTLRDNNPTTIRSRRSSSFVSANGDLASMTPYSDYTGISRSNSALNSKRTSLVSLRGVGKLDLFTPMEPKKIEYSNEIPELFKISNSIEDEDDDEGDYGHNETLSPFEEPSFTNRVVDCNQDKLFSDLQKNGNIDAETAEMLFLNKYQVPDLPIYLNSSYLNKIFLQFQKQHNDPTPSANTASTIGITHIIPHVNLNHLLTSSIRDEIISVACTTRYQGKFITQVMYAPCNYGNPEIKSS
ncbi:hypothetical protein NCAS_0F01090 [Naumovozyma castellii]|uniref:Association with the SNF1 complex (ASC) domain-containing protein n=1 Tax=Naumovozyma castellii TaxID=27288 RepID=G0VGH2_NAUCA|nr:hypothetical protein NCAS_0F01090 [Naumovozyma castellii CBS 4309]CCC70593.1 hypothetical protein NCAS_0F01090 [Naumovozyma castellii CBS 4309]